MDLVSVVDLKKDITPHDYLTLSLGNDDNATRAIEKARIWTKGKILSTGSTFDEDNEVVRTVIVTRALYELWFFVGFPDRAKAKLDDATDLIESYFGSIKTKGDRAAGSSDPGPADGAVVVPRVPDYGR